MGKYILGGGLIGLLAKEILGADWTIIPHGSSRYYSFKPAIADDEISVSARTDFSLLGDIAIRPYTRAFSVGGQLMFAPLKWLYDLYTEKLYGEVKNHFQAITPTEQVVSVVSASDLYKRLLIKYMSELTLGHVKYGATTTIRDGKITTSTGVELEYDQIISTIPLDALFKAVNIQHELQSNDVWVYHITTDQLDLEGADQVFVTDSPIDFYKVNQVGEYDYIFYCLREIKTPTPYFGAFTNNRLTIKNLAGTKHHGFVPLGNPYKPAQLADMKITCVGSHAEWDDSADIGACIIRLMKLRI